MCNLEKGRASVISHAQAKTLFHEFGHALQALLSRTGLQHFSGTRGELDFVEAPSQLMEYLCYDARVLPMFARHHTTREPIPAATVAALNEARKAFSALELQQQIAFAVGDQLIFGGVAQDKPFHEMSDAEVERALERLHARYLSVPHVPGTCWPARFGHLATYGAAYYSYTYARAFAADLWHTCFEADPLDARVGRRYRQEVLRFGGSKDPKLMLREMLGRPFSADALVREVCN